MKLKIEKKTLNYPNMLLLTEVNKPSVKIVFFVYAILKLDNKNTNELQTKFTKDRLDTNVNTSDPDSSRRLSAEVIKNWLNLFSILPKKVIFQNQNPLRQRIDGFLIINLKQKNFTRLPERTPRIRINLEFWINGGKIYTMERNYVSLFMCLFNPFKTLGQTKMNHDMIGHHCWKLIN